MSGWNEPLSVVEDLDPEPEQAPGRLQLRELVLGLLLLLGVLGFAGWQWWSQETRQSNYTRAVQALSRNDLDQARALFAGASGYKDADTRARDLDQRIARRDSLYASATTQFSAGNWVAALADLRALHEIQPNYRNSPALEPTAVARLTDQALKGTIALREPPDGPAGLYYYRDGRWVYLPDSDMSSRIRGDGADGYVAYDAHGDADDPDARRVMLANLQGPAALSIPLPFDPEDYTEYRWGQGGLWAFSYGRYTTASAPVRSDMQGAAAAYIRYGRYAIHKLALESSGGQAGEALLDVDGATDRYLLGAWDGAPIGRSAVISTTTVSLYAGAMGNGHRLIHTLRGEGIAGARLSRYGRYALVTTYTPAADGADYVGEAYRLLLFDLQTGAEPLQLESERARDVRDTDVSWPPISTTFVQSGVHAGKVLAAVDNDDHTSLRLYDPRLPAEPVLDVEVPTSTALEWIVTRADDRGLVVSGLPSTYDPASDSTETQTVPVVEISTQGQVTQTGVIMGKQGYPYPVDVARDYLAIVSVAPRERSMKWTVYSVPASNFGQPSVRPTVVYTQAMTGTSEVLDFARVRVGDNLITYLEGDALHARTYDGEFDVVLETGLRALYPRRFMQERYYLLR